MQVIGIPDAVVAARLLRVAAVCNSIRPSMLLELVAFATGSKPGLRFVVESDELGALVGGLDDAAIPWASRAVHLEPAGGTWTNVVSYETPSRRVLVGCGRSRALASEIVAAELDDPIEAGRMLGYPECCVRAFGELTRAGASWPQHLLAVSGHPRLVNARCNRFAADWGGIGLIGELFPCSLYCDAAIRYADRLRKAARDVGLLRLVLQAEADALKAIEILEDGAILCEPTQRGIRVEFAL
jgi:hypothetical protein